MAGVLMFTAVKAIANSPPRRSPRRHLEDWKAAAEADALRAAARDTRNSSFWYGGDRPRWLGPIPHDYPEHLTGEYPGDYGFDMAGLGRDPVAFANYFNWTTTSLSLLVFDFVVLLIDSALVLVLGQLSV